MSPQPVREITSMQIVVTSSLFLVDKKENPIINQDDKPEWPDFLKVGFY